MDNAQLIGRIKELSGKLSEKVKSHRQYIHQHPELSFLEVETSAYVQRELAAIGITDIKVLAGTGVVAMIYGTHHSENQPCIALRADMDALPIQEESDCAYPSLYDGIMHACGHDVHTSILLGVAEVLFELKDELPQPVKLIFQPGEEKNPGGASLLIAENVLSDPEVKEIYGLHVFPEMEAGKYGFRENLYMASCDEIYITIHGRGGHGAMPHQCIDPIYIGAQLLVSLQQIVSRRCDPKIPSVLSFGYFSGLGATNVIPSTVEMKGTFRTMDETWRAEAHELIRSQTEYITKASGATATIEISKGYPYLENDPLLTRKIKAKAIDLVGPENVEDLPIRMTAEDFSFYSQKVPSSFFRLGVRNEQQGIVYPVHHPKFNIDEKALQYGMEIMSYSVF